jgi:5-methyltetrahydrofolate--homocysteine methyltransferase
MTRTILDLVKERVVLLDGGMGTELIKHGFPQGKCPESWNVEKPDLVKKIHKNYTVELLKIMRDATPSYP